MTGQKCISMKNALSILVTAGYQNLKTHLRDCIPNYAKLYEERDKDGEVDIRKF